VVLPDDEPLAEDADGVLSFDHGCQFFRADTKRFLGMVNAWVRDGAVKPWHGRVIGVESGAKDFFGACSGVPLYVGNGGMHRIARHLEKEATNAGAVFNRGVRVSSIHKLPSGSWRVDGVGGEAAIHDTSEAAAASATHRPLTEVDYVLVTDASASFEGWHRASAGIAEAVPRLAAAVRSRARIPLFAVMVAFKRASSSQGASARAENTIFSATGDTTTIGAVFGATSPLWFAARSNSKPALSSALSSTTECWTLVSTPAFAVAEISETQMQDPETGAFIPQENGYLNGSNGPAAALWKAFCTSGEGRAAMGLGGGGDGKGEKAEEGGAEGGELEVVYLQGQRWGSAFPAPRVKTQQCKSAAGHWSVEEAQEEGDGRVRVAGVMYDSRTPDMSLSTERQQSEDQQPDYFADLEKGAFYAGDFCSQRTPGVEAAVLSAVDAAEHIISHGLANSGTAAL
jgi:predicted NAD/FAD-dependent oxidoreductase